MARRAVDISLGNQTLDERITQRFNEDIITAFEVQARLKREGGRHRREFHIMMTADEETGATAVRDYISVKTPILTQDLGQQPGIGCTGNVIDGGVGRHDGSGFSAPDTGLKSRQIVFA